MSTSVYQMVTDRIIEELEKGQIPWQKPWILLSGKKGINRNGMAYNRVTGKPYSLLNQMLLGRPGEWMSFKQCKAAGGSVRKGEKGRPCVFWKQLKVEEEVEIDGEMKKQTRMIPMLRYYTVFHISQCEGIEARKFKDNEEEPTPGFDWEPEEEAEQTMLAYLARNNIRLYEMAGDSAFYRPADDSITLPFKKQFKEMAEYYSTAYHEMVHSTGHKDRLNRLRATHFGSGEYSQEELTAEMGAAMSLNRLGIETPSSFKNNAAYIQNWLQHLREDNKAVVYAASRAEKAVHLIFNDED